MAGRRGLSRFWSDPAQRTPAAATDYGPPTDGCAAAGTVAAAARTRLPGAIKESGSGRSQPCRPLASCSSACWNASAALSRNFAMPSRPSMVLVAPVLNSL